MGFYSAATIVDDAKRHGTRMRPIDAQQSDWDCTLEDGEVRMGLRYVRGMRAAEGQSALAARARRPFDSLDDFVARAGVCERTLKSLAAAGAFESLGRSRREALWEVPRLALAAQAPMLLERGEAAASFRALDAFDTVAWDYRASSHSPRDHPLGPMRPLLTAQGLPDAQTLGRLANGARARYAGLVICRQRPGTASGVTFMTLEDETGFVNVVVWTQVLDSYRVLVKTASFLGVTGKMQVEDGVTHLIAESLWPPALALKPEHVHSRDFH